MPTLEDFDPDAEPDPDPDAAEPGTAEADVTAVDPAATVALDAGPARDAAAPLAGAWLPPSTVQRPLSRPAPYAEPARPEAVAASRPAPAPFAPQPGPAAVKPGEAPLLADLPLDAPSDLPGWLVLVGGGVGAVAFLLPWAPLVFDFYWDSWGLANAARFLVFLLVLATAVLAIVPNRIGTWFRTGVLGLVAGGVALGLALPYLFGDFAVPFGVLVEAVAAILLIVGGAVAVAPRRSRTGPPEG